MMRSKQTRWRDDEISDEDDTLCSVFWDFCFLNFSNRPIYRIEQVKRNALTYGEITHSHSHTQLIPIKRTGEKENPKTSSKHFRSLVSQNFAQQPGVPFFQPTFLLFSTNWTNKNCTHTYTQKHTFWKSRAGLPPSF